MADPTDTNSAGDTLTHLEWLEDVVMPEDGTDESAADLRLLAVLSSRGTSYSPFGSDDSLNHRYRAIGNVAVVTTGILGRVE